MKKKIIAILSFVLLVALGAVVVAEYVFNTNIPLGTANPRTIDERIRETKDAVQEIQNIDHYWPLDGTVVDDPDAGFHRRVMFQAPTVSPPTVAANQGWLGIKDYDGGSGSKAELTWKCEDGFVLQLTELNTAGDGAAWNLTGVYENDVSFTNTANTVNSDAITVTDLGFITLPAGTTNTTEGNLRYDDTGDTVSYRTASAWSTLAITSGLLKFDSGNYTGTAETQNVSCGSGNAAVFVMIKRDTTADNSTYAFYDGTAFRCFEGNNNAAPGDDTPIAQHADGFTVKGTDDATNKSGDTYYYFAVYEY